MRLKGVDIFDPTTGEVRSSAKVEEDVACWFVDTDYSGDSFFVRHAYFLGGKDPFEKRKAALRAEIDADAWATLYSKEGRPFPAPKSGRIAVKVINRNSQAPPLDGYAERKCSSTTDMSTAAAATA